MSKRRPSIKPNGIDFDRTLSQAQAIANNESASARDRFEAQLTLEHIQWAKTRQVAE